MYNIILFCVLCLFIQQSYAAKAKKRTNANSNVKRPRKHETVPALQGLLDFLEERRAPQKDNFDAIKTSEEIIQNIKNILLNMHVPEWSREMHKMLEISCIEKKPAYEIWEKALIMSRNWLNHTQQSERRADAEYLIDSIKALNITSKYLVN